MRAGGGATASSVLLAPCVARLHKAYPRLRFYIREAGSNSIAEDVSQGRLDIGIVTTPIHSASGIDIEPLVEDEIVLVAPAGHPLTNSALRAHRLDGQQVIAFEAGSAIRRIIDETLLAKRVTLQIVAELRSIPTIFRMVRETGIPAFVSRLTLPTKPDWSLSTLPTSPSSDNSP